MIIGIGTDLVAIDRVAVVLERHGARFMNRVFDGQEQYAPSPFKGEGWGGGQSPELSFKSPSLTLPLAGGGDAPVPASIAAHYAKRWAAKEAVAKALGVGIDQGVYLRDIVIIRGPNGAPSVRLQNGAAKMLQNRAGPSARIHLSLSDDAGFALAFVVIEV